MIPAAEAAGLPSVRLRVQRVGTGISLKSVKWAVVRKFAQLYFHHRKQSLEACREEYHIAGNFGRANFRINGCKTFRINFGILIFVCMRAQTIPCLPASTCTCQ